MHGTAALILAAGLGTRFGGGKLLAPIEGRPMLQHVLDLATAAELEPVVVVLGGDAVELIAACTWRDEVRVVNERPETGLASSVRLGLGALSASPAQRCLVLPADQPFTTPAQVAAILEMRGAVVVPRFNGHAGSPVALDRSVWPLASALEGDRGFSQLFAARPDLVTYIDIPGTSADIDTQSDLDAISRA